MAALLEARVPAMGFVDEVRLEGEGGGDPKRFAALELWPEVAGIDEE